MTPADAERFSSLELRLTVEVGRVRTTLAELARLQPGAVLVLDTPSDKALDVRLGDVRIADGESVTAGGRLAVRLLAIRSDQRRV